MVQSAEDEQRLTELFGVLAHAAAESRSLGSLTLWRPGTLELRSTRIPRPGRLATLGFQAVASFSMSR